MPCLGTNFGVFRSMDAGESWSALNAGLPPGGASVVLDPKDPNTLYAATSGGVFVITFRDHVYAVSHRE